MPATSYAGFLARAFPSLRRHRDILLVDQRGTWNSNPLTCSADVVTCRDSLTARADLAAYSSVNAADDLDAVREWLGYDSLNIYGVSYGTKVAQVYAKRHGSHLRAAVLYGVVPLSVPFQLELARSSQQSLDRVLQRCAADSACAAAFPNVRTEFDSVLLRLSRDPAPPITDRALRNVIQTMLGTARGAERIPLLIHRAYSGDFNGLGPGTAPSPGPNGGPAPQPAPRGVFLSLLCGESVDAITRDQVASATEGSFFGDAPIRSIP